MSKLNLKLTEAGKTYESGFNGKFGPLEGRDDLNIFLIQAYQANRRDHIAFFQDPPTLQALLKEKAEEKLSTNEVYGIHPLNLPAGATIKPTGEQAAANVVSADTPVEKPAQAVTPAPSTPQKSQGTEAR